MEKSHFHTFGKVMNYNVFLGSFDGSTVFDNIDDFRKIKIIDSTLHFLIEIESNEKMPKFQSIGNHLARLLNSWRSITHFIQHLVGSNYTPNAPIQTNRFRSI